VIAVALGRFDTETLRNHPDELWRSAAATVPVQRLGSVEEYAWLIALRPLGASLSVSVVTLDGALDNWTGPRPPSGLTRDGQVSTKERRPAA
jgi:citronellol/citronellal dehydrogenase